MTSAAEVRSGAEALLSSAAVSLLEDRHAEAESAFGKLREEMPDEAAAGLFVCRAAQRRWGDALALVDELLDGSGSELVSFRGSGVDLPAPPWRHEGGGSAAAQAGALRLTGLGTPSLYAADLPAPSNREGTRVEFAVVRGPGPSGDCRLELSDGTVRETVLIEPRGLALFSSGATVRWPTATVHFYALEVVGQTSRLYADGQPVLASVGLPASYEKALRFGVYAAASDSESTWLLVRATRLVPGRKPAASWPIEVWNAAVERARAEGDPSLAFDRALIARTAHPADARALEILKDASRGVLERPEHAQHARRVLTQLTLADRAAVLRGAETAEVLVSCDRVGVRFHRRPRGLRDRWRDLFQRRPPDDSFWALRDVSLEARSGELVAIIGRNGAGKSTLLNVLVDVLAPDTGRVRVVGDRILLKPGVGFVPALSGRDNIYLSGLYLGLTRAEIRERFEEIVEFAELWDAIDRPVRTYSTGMVSRLQFALATTIEPDILLLDELLGAGDVSFGEKSRARMQQLLRRARAVIVVTHDLAFVREQCSRAIVLEHGEVLYQGSPESAVVAYQDLLVQRPKRAERATE